MLAIPTTSADVATRRLTTTLGLVGLVVAAVVGLLLWWVDRLGLRPIAEMTDAADAITAGDTTRRVPPGPPGTEAARLGEALNAMIDTTAGTQERMRRFVADASHELRTPLTTLQGYAALHTGRVGSRSRMPRPGGGRRRRRAGAAEAGRDRRGGRGGRDGRRRSGGRDGRDGRRHAPDGRGGGPDASARRRAARPGRLDDLGVVEREPVDLGVLVRDVASDLRVVAPDRVVTVVAPESLVVTGDRDRLTQALVGLTSNAVRHTPAGTPVWLSVVEVTGVGARRRGRRGARHPARAPAHVFERFHRVDRGRSSASGGTGLGLAIVDAIARAHGGSASVASQLGHGSTFSITLPR